MYEEDYYPPAKTAPSAPLREWETTQSRTFKNWINYQLEARNMHVENLAEDLSDGLAFLALLEQLSGSKVLS
jgi:hypothetical protein